MKRDFKISKIDFSLIICLFGYFITGTTLRNGVYSNRILLLFPPIFFIGLIISIFCLNKKKNDLSDYFFDKKFLFVYMILLIFAILSLLLSQTLIEKATLLISIILPVIIIGIKIKSKYDYDRVIKVFYTFITITIALIVVGNIIDLLFNYSFTKFIYDFTGIESYYYQYKSGRSISYMGHPLFTAEIAIIYYLLSNLVKKNNIKVNTLITFIISLFCVLVTKSRVALLLLLLSFLIFNHNKSHLKYLVIIIVFMIFLYFAGFLNPVLERFKNFGSNDVRNTSLVELIEKDELNFYCFKGQSLKILGYATKLSAALEYPVLRWAYGFGIIVAILMSILYFVYPIILLLKRKQYTLLFSLLIVMLDVNSYSALGDAGIKSFLYIMFCFIILNMSNNLIMERGL